MKKIDFSLARASIISLTAIIILMMCDYLRSNMPLAHNLDALIITFIAITLTLFLAKKKSRGLYVSPQKLHYNNNQQYTELQWEKVSVHTLVNFPFWKEIILKIDNEKYHVSISWMTEKSIIEILPMLPKNHNFSLIVENYVKFRKINNDRS